MVDIFLADIPFQISPAIKLRIAGDLQERLITGL
jgi:hypothetical protein